MHKSLPTLGNEKKQYKIKLGELIFLWAKSQNGHVMWCACNDL